MSDNTLNCISNEINDGKQNAEINDNQYTKINNNQHAENIKLNLDLPCIEFSYLFWSPLFLEDEINQLKTLINTNENDLETIISTIMPSYKISETFNKYINIYYKDIKYRSTDDINKSKSILAGILTYKFMITNQDYYIIIKGGKAIQLLLSKKTSIKFDSNDIDILLVPINGTYDYNKLKNLSRQISLLIKWIFNVSNNDFDKLNYIQILPFVNQAYPYIDKISYKNQPENYESKYFTALVDIDYGPVYNNIFYEDLDITNYEHDFFGKIVFRYQNINSLFFEKLYYLNFYALQYEYICLNPESYPIYSKLYSDSSRFIIKFAKQINSVIFLLFKSHSAKYLPPQKIEKEKKEIILYFVEKYKLKSVNNLISFIVNTSNTMNNLRLRNNNIYQLPKILN